MSIVQSARTSGFVRLTRRHLAGFALAIALGLWAPLAAAQAQDDSGQIVLIVTDATTSKPIPLARVLLDGPIMTSEVTTATGQVVFHDVPAGVYTARIGKSGYQTDTTASFEVGDGKTVSVDVHLAVVASGVTSLGTVTVRSSANISSESVTQDSPIRKLSPTLNDALGKLAGVSVGTDSTDDNAAETISLEGHDASQTQLALDGIPLSSPGVAGDLRSISSDLFSGASVSFNPVAGALGGSVNYRTLEPTRSWVFGVSQMFGNLSASSTILSMQGSVGDLGVAYVHSFRGSVNLLDEQKYLDASGFDYTHQGASQTGGDLIKLRTLVGGTNSVSATYLSSNGYRDALCNVFNGVVPCGYGPGNYNDNHFALESLADTALVGMTTMQLSLYGTQSSASHDLLQRYIAGVYAPFGSASSGTTRGAALSAQLPAKEKHTISLQLNATSQASSSVPLIPSASAFSTGSATSSYSSFSVVDTIHANDHLTLGEHIGAANSNRMGASLLAGIQAGWTPTSSDAFAGNLDYGSNGAGPARFGVLTDPASLQFECSGPVGFGSGPGESAGNQTGLTARATWQHRFGAIGELTGSAYHQVQYDTLLNALVNGSALPPGYFPPGYFGTAQEIYQSDSVCGNPTGTFGPTNLYLNVPVAGVTMVYQGFQLSGDVNLTRSFAAEPFWTTQVVKPISQDPMFENPYSPIISGQQLPGVPLHQAGITFDLRAPHSPLELLADARYTSPGNRNYLPGYVTADAGLDFDFTHGSLTIAESNIFNKFGYEFASSSYAVGPPTLDAGTLEQIGRPLAPRQLNVTYSVKIGYGQTQVAAAPANRPGPSSGSTGGGNAGPGGGRSIFASLPPLPQTPPTDPFAVQSSRPNCTQEAAPQAAQTLAGMKTYVQAVEAQKTAAGYPDALPSQPPTIPGFTVGYHALQTTYALTFTPQTFTGLRGFLGCAPIHVGTKEQADALHLYVPQASSFIRAPLAYTPAAGLYIVRQPPPPGEEQFRVYKLPTSPPQQPLALVQSDRCTSDLKPVAQSLLASLSAYVQSKNAGQATPAQPAGWAVTPHAVAKGYWLELQPQAPVAVPALLNCARVATGSADDIKATGYGAAALPSLNFAPALGLYIQRNQQARPPG
ncbi:MAG: TonB-dependent receptor [Candidatus Eremiobacteraeota bacterium]|nr:TonB-dependent receptor [Candidatus Eremiobacteraeota bacterium]